jgi:hypothetical protein
MKELKIIDIINTQNAILHEFGLQVYDRIKPLLQANENVLLSFEGLKNVTSGFSNASIGKLFCDFKNADQLIQLSGLEGHPLWQEKVNNAITLAKNPEIIRLQNNAISELLIS